MLNLVAIMGRLVADPETTQTSNGLKVSTFTLAVDTSKEDTSFIDIKAFDSNAVEYCHKGDKIAVSGSLIQEKWTNKDGQNRSKLVVIARAIEFAELKNTEEVEEPAPAPVKKPIAKTPYRK